MTHTCPIYMKTTTHVFVLYVLNHAPINIYVHIQTHWQNVRIRSFWKISTPTMQHEIKMQCIACILTQYAWRVEDSDHHHGEALFCHCHMYRHWHLIPARWHRYRTLNTRCFPEKLATVHMVHIVISIVTGKWYLLGYQDTGIPCNAC